MPLRLKMRSRLKRASALATVWLLFWPNASHASEPAADLSAKYDFFEAKVRPVLMAHCIECHGPQAQEAGLRLDNQSAAMRGATSGPVIVPGVPQRSRLVTAIRYAEDVQMPPEGKLPADAIDDLVHWVAQGAHWPPTAESPAAESASATAGQPAPANHSAANHWAFQPVRPPLVPSVTEDDWSAEAIDRFVLAKLRQQGLSPAPKADRRTLLRRASFDLLGLPPTADEVDRFEQDAAPDAWHRQVDRLLASPHYGERWARHWLDVARYADTKGYVFTQDPRYAYAYTYRDYVIDALNADLPYDRFVLEQLAADHLVDASADPRPLAALGFLTLGRRFAFNIHEIIDDRIDVVTRGLMGLTVQCARCHDHKYDPIPTADYYSLYGVFASCEEPDELPLIGQPMQTAAYDAYRQELDARQEKLKARVDAEYEQTVERLRRHVADYLVQAALPAGADPADVLDISLSAEDLRPAALKRWKSYLTRRVRPDDPLFSLWHRCESLPTNDFSQQISPLWEQLRDDSTALAGLNPRLRQELLADEPPSSLAQLAARYGKAIARVDQEFRDLIQKAAEQTAAGAAAPPVTAMPQEADEQLRLVLYGDESPVTFPKEELRRFVDRATANELNKLRTETDAFEAASPEAPPRANVMRDRAAPAAARVFKRGDPNRPGDEVPRQFLAVAAGASRQPFSQGSGRLELARAVVAAENPLTARVIVNRVWQHLFGVGLVRTASDLGVRSDPPAHPELLDHLAAALTSDGWSLKQLQRRILLSQTYCQSSRQHGRGQIVDPENRLLWRMNRRRLEFEPWRDASLAVCGHLNGNIKGKSVNLFTAPYNTRRSVYAWIDRQDLAGTLRAFDFANPDASAPGRPETIVPQQALLAMNSPQIIETARRLADRARQESRGSAGNDDSARLKALYRLVFARTPDTEELRLGLDYLATTGRQHGSAAVRAALTGGPKPSPLDPWERLAQALLMTNEFIFLD